MYWVIVDHKKQEHIWISSDRRSFLCYTSGLTEQLLFLAYFPKIKVGLSNHQSVCLCPSVYLYPTNNFWTAW
jgi:hypothetical protein